MILSFFTPGPMEMAIIGIVALLLFGKRLPVVARSIGGSFSAFKSGLKDVNDAVDDTKETLRTEAADLKSAVKE